MKSIITIRSLKTQHLQSNIFLKSLTKTTNINSSLCLLQPSNELKTFKPKITTTKKNNNNNNYNLIQSKRFFSSSINNSYSISDEKNLIKGDSYQDTYNSFKWTIPEYFNIGFEICDKHVQGGNKDKIAIKYIQEDGKTSKSYTFNDLYKESNLLCNAFQDFGIKKGDRVGVLLSQGFETALSHTSVIRSGMISIPLFTLFGPDALEYRLNNSEASCILTDKDNLPKLLSISNNIPSLKKIIVFDISSNNNSNNLNNNNLNNNNNLIVNWDNIKNKYNNLEFKAVKTKSEDPAVIIFTSGTTGNPKGCLHAQRVLLGHLPGVQFPQNFFPQKSNDYVFYTPADWAWIGGLFDVLLPSLYYGVTVLAHRALKFDPVKIGEIMLENNVTTCFLPPTALKMMRLNSSVPKNTNILSIGSGGESLGDRLLEWGKETFGGITINEFYGQTEANLIVGNCSAIMPVKAGSMGKSIPGHRVEIIDKDGNILPPNTIGEIALSIPDPVVFLRYWNNEKATKSKFISDKWLLTGDLGKRDNDGYLWYVSRDDDIINSSGYRIGPSEIEHCLLRLPYVLMSAAVGIPDPIRGEIVKAFIVLKDNCKPTKELELEIQNFVKTNLAAHEYPREIEFIDQLPMTTTGKIIRKDLRLRHKSN